METNFQKHFKEKVLEVRRLDHKGNNILFKIITPNQNFLLKKYSTIQDDNWNRGKTEFFAINYLWNKGFREIPKPFNFNEQDNLGIYSFEDGRILDQSEIKDKDILAAASFLAKIHNLDIKDKNNFKCERTKCLEFFDYIKLIENRYEKITSDFVGGETVKNFLNKEVYPKIKELKEYFLKSSEKFNTCELPLAQQVVTPGDFGFHNILIDSDKYVFIDFEFCGRDDPAKQILDFLHHDKTKLLNKELKDLFLKRYHNHTSWDDCFKDRLIVLDPLIGMNWLLIYLNPFSKNYLNHLRFSQKNLDVDALFNERLEKAKVKLKNLSFFK
ncbi:MAG: aminoglycoside phosphotransferase family protein [archaeon]